MTTKSVTETEEVQTEVVDDISDKLIESDQPDVNKLAALKALNQAKQQERKQEQMNMSAKIVQTKERSMVWGVIGTGQGGSRLAESFHKLGYDAVAINTAIQDLKHIQIPDSNKLLIQSGALGGAAKELAIGQDAAETHRGEIVQLVNSVLPHSQVNILCSSLGGGSGAGSIPTMIDILTEVGKPLIVIAVLPMSNDDVQTKHNSIETLSKLAQYTREKKVVNLIVVDNARIESIYHSVSHMDFFDVANKAIVGPLDAINMLSTMPSRGKPLDGTELAKIMIDGEGLSVYGEFTVSNFEEDTAIAEAVVNNLSQNLLAEGFDLKQAKYAGFMVAANKEVWQKIPASSINYANYMLSDLCGPSIISFKGSYEVDNIPENVVKVYSIFSGLGLPQVRVSQLKAEAKEYMSAVKEKNAERNLTLELDTGVNEAVSAAQKVKDKIASKSSAFGKLMGAKVVDRRK